MNRMLNRLLSILLVLATGLSLHATALAEDIDLFASGAAPSADTNPNVLFVIDNTSNWSSNDQKWPNGLTQGQSELRALKQAVGGMDEKFNAGLMLFNDKTEGGGYVRFAMRQMTPANKLAFQNLLQHIYDNFSSPAEKVSSSADYSGVLFDVYKYLGGYTSPPRMQTGQAGSPVDRLAFGTKVLVPSAPAALADPLAYTDSTFTEYAPPSTSTSTCSRNYVVFIGNGWPNKDDIKRQSFGNKHLGDLLQAVEGDVTEIPGVASNKNNERFADEWARYLYRTDVSSAPGQQNVAVFTIDVFNAKPDANQTALLRSMARVGGGKYFEAKSETAILSSLQEILVEVQAASTVFASAALPISANSRAENDNRVFLGMFRPDRKAEPRWYGNVKAYQLADFGGYIDLADVNGRRAINASTGFLTECAVSFWTVDSGAYWASVPLDPPPVSGCTLTDFDAYNLFSDYPDGPFVEKGGVSGVLRRGNNPPATTTTPTWLVNRRVLTVSGSGLADFTTTTSGLSASLVNYITGRDTEDENLDSVTGSQARPSIHGDVIHSRLLPLTYTGNRGTVVYYGANDGTLRAVNASTGKELWAFIAPEFFSRLSRLQTNSPIIRFPQFSTSIVPTPTPKDYFFDGPIGAYQNASAATSWIFAGMRRGGRMVYGFNVSDPDNPSLLWRIGCPNLANDTGCTSGFTGIGQTWSNPSVAFIKGHDGGNTPVIVMGGGYDSCEDQDTATPSCSSAKGRAIYVINAQTGALLKTFTDSQMRSVAADISLVDVDFDGNVDYAYAADTGGNIWRISFVDPGTNAVRSASAWSVDRAAYTNGGGRKFLYGPALLPTQGKVYLTLGSGDRERPLISNYPYTQNVLNRFYVYLDDPTVSGAHDLDGSTGVLNVSSDPGCSEPGLLPGGTYRSWYMNLNENGQGEQVVTSSLIAGGLVVFSTNRPTPPAADSCSVSLGVARGYWVSLINGSGAIGVSGSCGGTRSDTFIGGGMPPSPVRGVVRIDGKAQSVIISAAQRDGAASSTVSAQKLVLPITSRRQRIYWLQEGER
jgi:type IV pilus assembly protein PilY1